MRKRSGILEAWLARAVQTWPEHTARHLLDDPDPFHNPVGHALRTGLPVLLDAVIEGTTRDDVATCLEPIVRIGAVQDAAPGQAISFLFLLKPILREQLAGDVSREEIQAMGDRIDSLALVAFDLFMRCREEVCRIQADEVRRGTYVQRHVGGRQA